MHRKAQQEPAVSVIATDADTLAVVVGNSPVRVGGTVALELFDNAVAEGAEVLGGNVQPYLAALGRLFKGGDKVLDRLALAL